MAKAESNAYAKNIKHIVAGELFLVPASEIGNLAKEGFKTLMVKEPEVLPMPELTMREHTCLKLHAIDCLTTKDIAYKMGVSERMIRLLFEALRGKFQCTTNSAIIAKVYLSGWHNFL